MLIDLTRRREHLKRHRNRELQQILRPLHAACEAREDYASFDPCALIGAVDQALQWLRNVRQSDTWADFYVWPGLTNGWDGAFYEFSFGWDPLGGIQGGPWLDPEGVMARSYQIEHKVQTPSRMPEHAWQAVEAVEGIDPLAKNPIYVVERRILESEGRPVGPHDAMWDEQPCQWRWILWSSPHTGFDTRLRYTFLGTNEGDWSVDRLTHGDDDGIEVHITRPEPDPVAPDPDAGVRTLMKLAALVKSTQHANPEVQETLTDAIAQTWDSVREAYAEVEDTYRDLGESMQEANERTARELDEHWHNAINNWGPGEYFGDG